MPRFGNVGDTPSLNSALPPAAIREAIPQYISGRTSYLPACLAFHSYPHLIRELFKVHRFGPPPGLTQASTWTGIDHWVSGLWPATLSPCSDSLSLRLRLWLNLAANHNSLAHYAKGTRSGISFAEAQDIALPLLVSTRFQVLFHSPHWGTFHLSLTVLVHYRSRVSI